MTENKGCLGNLYEGKKDGWDGAVYNTSSVAPALRAKQGGIYIMRKINEREQGKDENISGKLLRTEGQL